MLACWHLVVNPTGPKFNSRERLMWLVLLSVGAKMPLTIYLIHTNTHIDRNSEMKDRLLASGPHTDSFWLPVHTHWDTNAISTWMMLANMCRKVFQTFVFVMFQTEGRRGNSAALSGCNYLLNLFDVTFYFLKEGNHFGNAVANWISTTQLQTSTFSQWEAPLNEYWPASTEATLTVQENSIHWK